MKLACRLAIVFASLAGACTTATDPREPAISVGGSSHLVDVFAQVAAETNVPVELLAALSYVETRFRFVDSEEHGASAIGLFGLPAADLAQGARLAGVTDGAARSDALASVRAGAALLRANAPSAHGLDQMLATLEPGLGAEVRRALVRGIDGHDVLGESIVVAARPGLDAGGGFGTMTQALGLADYAGAIWNAASTANYSVASRGLADVTHVVIHTVQGSYGSCINWFKNPAAQVSAHYVVKSTDGEVTQMVEEKNVAWHDKCFNTNTVGIEHEGYVEDPELWYTEAMYLESAKLSAYLADKYGIPKTHAHILGHGDAPDCSTHTDPGPGWNWDHYLDLVQTGGAPHFDGIDVDVDAPASLVSGEHATVTVRVTNNGNATWDLDLTRLGTAAPQDRESAFFADGDWIAPNRPTGVDASVPPGEVGTFTFEVVAPIVREPTVFDETFQLVQDAMWFGPDVHVMLRVVPDGEQGGCTAGGTGSGAGACAMLLLGAGLGRRRRRR